MDPDPRHHWATALSRRGFVARGALVASSTALVAAGCSLNNPFDSTPVPATEAVRDLAPDVAIAVEAVVAIQAARRLIEAVAVAHPDLAGLTSPLSAMHDAHLAALVDAVPDRVDTSSPDGLPAVPARRALAANQVGASERSLHDQVIALALRAESGPFARLLGSIAASISQHLAASKR